MRQSISGFPRGNPEQEPRLAQQGVQVIAVEPGSLAEEAGICPGDTLLEIHGEAVLDQLNYQFLISREDEASRTASSASCTRCPRASGSLST
jgi:S1-C subfamily serine protease